MAITPSEAYSLSEDEVQAVKTLEQKIDAEVRRRVSQTGLTQGQSVWFDMTVPPRYRARIRQIYDAAGWTVEFKSDQRDGNSVVLTPKSNGSWLDR